MRNSQFIDELLRSEGGWIEKVLALKWECRKLWRSEAEGTTDLFWLEKLKKEVEELDRAIGGTHEHCPDWELMQIAAIALNWLEYRNGKRDFELENIQLLKEIRLILLEKDSAEE